MTNTMEDLRREVASRLRNTLHGREIDTMEKGMPELEHMLGIVTLGAISTEEALSGSFLDCNHRFWDEYYKDIKANGQAEKEIESAVRSLKDDNIFRVSTPYGEDAGIWYCEVDELNDPDTSMITTCRDCGATILAEPSLKNTGQQYRLTYTINCPDCNFTSMVGATLTRL